MDKVWVVISKSCPNCNEIICTAFDHKPNKDEIKFNRNKLDGLWCGDDYIFECEINGKTVEIIND
jgi:hypothetical protein